MPVSQTDGRYCDIGFPHLPFSFWVLPRRGIEPTPSLQRKLVAIISFNHWAAPPKPKFGTYLTHILALTPMLYYPLSKLGLTATATLHDENPGQGCRPHYAFDGITGAGFSESASRDVSYCTTNNVGPPWFKLDMRTNLRVIEVSFGI